MDQHPLMHATIQLSTIRWTARARKQLRDEAARLGLDPAGARLRVDLNEGRLIGTLPELTFWYYPYHAPPGALYLVQHCPICGHPFPVRVQTAADVDAFGATPLPPCRPEGLTWERLRHWRHARRGQRPPS